MAHYRVNGVEDYWDQHFDRITISMGLWANIEPVALISLDCLLECLSSDHRLCPRPSELGMSYEQDPAFFRLIDLSEENSLKTSVTGTYPNGRK